MKKIIFRLDMGLVGATRSCKVEYPDDVTEEEINADLDAWASEQIGIWWEEES